MNVGKLYRIFVENVNQVKIENMASEYFEAYTIYPAIGCWQGAKENTLIIEVLNGDELFIKELAGKLKDELDQMCVLVQELDVRFELVY